MDKVKIFNDSIAASMSPDEFQTLEALDDSIKERIVNAISKRIPEEKLEESDL